MAGMSLPTPTLHTARLRLRPFDDADGRPGSPTQTTNHVA